MWGKLFLLLLASVVKADKSSNPQNICGFFNATDQVATFNITDKGQPITEGYACEWKITNNDKKNIQISIDPAQGGDEKCIGVASTSIKEGTLLCATDEETSIISSAKPVTVSFHMRAQTTMPSFQVHYKSTNDPPNYCGPSSHLAFDDEESFYVYNGAQNIPKDHKCNWTITSTYKKPITVYLKKEGKQDDKQCIQVADPSSTTQETICVKDKEADFDSIDNSVVVRFPGKSLSADIPPFKVYFKLKSPQPYLCGTSEYTATEEESSITLPSASGIIPDDLECTWTIKGKSSRNIQVYLKPDEDSSTNQCVLVASKNICAVNGQQSFESTAQPVNVTYTLKQPHTKVKAFKIFFKLGNNVDNRCGSTQLTAATTEKWFNVYSAEGMIPTNHKCSWLISGTGNKRIAVYLSKDGAVNQCIKATSASSPQPSTICAQPEQNKFISKYQPITVVYPGRDNMVNVTNFKIYYKLAAAGHKPWNLFTFGVLLVILQYLH